MYTLMRLGRNLRVMPNHIRIDLAVMARVVRLSATGTFQAFIGMTSWIGLVRVTATFGAEALAGYVIAIRIVVRAAPGLGTLERRLHDGRTGTRSR